MKWFSRFHGKESSDKSDSLLPVTEVAEQQSLPVPEDESQQIETRMPVMYDRQLVWLSLILMLVGLVMVSSASIQASYSHFEVPFHYMFKHAVYLFLAVSVMAFVVHVPTERWMNWSTLMLAVCILMLFMVLFAGKSVNGASRWIPLGR